MKAIAWSDIYKEEWVQLVQKPITEHPQFHTPRNDWRVIPARKIESHFNGDYDVEGYEIPEDRSKWKPEEDGKCLADFWDFERGEFKPDAPLCLAGVKTFLAAEKLTTEPNEITPTRH